MRNWIPIFIMMLSLMAWFALNYVLIGDRPPTWDYGSTPYIPGQHFYSTEEPGGRSAAPPVQLPPMENAEGRP